MGAPPPVRCPDARYYPGIPGLHFSIGWRFVIHALIRSQAAFEHFLAALILLARIGDIGSTYLATPRLVLEANPVARRLGWPFALLTLLLAAVPYFNTAAAVIVLVPSLLVAARNFGQVWLIRGLGEERLLDLQLEVARRGSFTEAFRYVCAEAGFLAVAAIALMTLSSGPQTWSYVFAIGLLIWAVTIFVHRTIHFKRVFRLAREGTQQSPIEIVSSAA